MADQVTSVTCNHCGAPLQVPPTTRFLTCTYCGTRLEIHRSGNAVYTEILEAIDQRTAEMAQDLDVIRRQNEIERLDREWQLKRDSLMVRGKHGSVSKPSVAGGLVGALVAGGFGVFWTVTAASAGAPGFFVLFGVLFVIMAIVMGISTATKATEYQDAEQNYLRQRESLMQSNRNQP